MSSPDSAIELVRAIPADEDVAAVVAIELIVAILADDHIVSAAAVDRVIAVASPRARRSRVMPCSIEIVIVAIFPWTMMLPLEAERSFVYAVDLHHHFALRRSGFGDGDRVFVVRADDLEGFLG